MATAQYVIFRLQELFFGVEILKIKEVLSYRKIAPIPGLQSFIKGLINLRGTIMPVFDPRDRFRLPSVSYTPFHVILVMEIQGRVMGILADEIVDVLDIDSRGIQDTTNLPPGLQTQYLKGITHKDSEMILLLDMDRLLHQEELEALDAT
jgi:purine-binding chemotaxis protein CheW